MHAALRLQLICALLFIQLAAGNVEKTIFVAPPPSTVSVDDTAIDDLGLDRLSPTEFTLRTSLNASFPTDAEPYGSESWFYLENLNPGQRYEVRICWLATQPTSFSLTTYPLQEILSDSSLLPALLKFSDARLIGSFLPSTKPDDVPSHMQPKARLRHDHLHRSFLKYHDENSDNPPAALASPPAQSTLFLRIYAAADYFTTNTTLMDHVPPVVADIILDPFLFNIFPRSLVPTALYMIVIAVVAYFISGFLSKSLIGIVATAENNQVVGGSASKKKR